MEDKDAGNTSMRRDPTGQPLPTAAEVYRTLSQLQRATGDSSIQQDKLAPLFQFEVETYSYDRSGYYLAYDDWMTVRVKALTSAEAKQKAILLRDDDYMVGTHNAWGARVKSAEELSS